MKFRIAIVVLFLLLSGSLFPQITLISPNSGEIWNTGKQPKILWKSQGVSKFNVFLSTDGGTTWSSVFAGLPASLPYYKWTVPSATSNECLLKLVSADNDSVYDVSDSLFTIKPDDGAGIKIIVLGSSTAAGTGPTTLDSAWVWKYREYLFQRNTSTQVTNLAIGGYTTYHIMPDDFVAPSGRPARVLGRNITAAVLASPNAIIINMPSNDAANNYPVSEQVSNYELIMAKANEKNIPLWVATPQPRNFSQAQINLQFELLDSTYKMFGDHTIDFWTDIAGADGRIISLYNSGDGVHLNNAGHRILFARVVDKNIYEQINTVSAIEEKPLVAYNFKLEQNYPNPFNPETNINYQLSETGFVTLKVFDMLGREVATLLNEVKEAGAYQTVFNTQLTNNQQRLTSGVYFYQFRVGEVMETKKMILLR